MSTWQKSLTEKVLALELGPALLGTAADSCHSILEFVVLTAKFLGHVSVNVQLVHATILIVLGVHVDNAEFDVLVWRFWTNLPDATLLIIVDGSIEWISDATFIRHNVIVAIWSDHAAFIECFLKSSYNFLSFVKCITLI